MRIIIVWKFNLNLGNALDTFLLFFAAYLEVQG